MNTVSAPKINKKVIAKLNKSIPLTEIDGKYTLAVREDGLYALNIESDQLDVDVRVSLYDYDILDKSPVEVADVILQRIKKLTVIFHRPTIKEIYFNKR